MEHKKIVQQSLNRSLSGLKENPYLAQRIIAQAKGETQMKKKSFGALLLGIILALAMLGTAYALFSSKVAEIFGAQYGQETGNWLEGGKVAQLNETVTLGDVMITLDEVVYRNRGLYGVGTIRAIDQKDVLLPFDLVSGGSEFFTMTSDFNVYAELAQKLAAQSRTNGGRLLTAEILPEQVGVDGGTQLSFSSIGYFDTANEDGSVTFTFEAEDGNALEDGESYQLQIHGSVWEVDTEGNILENTKIRKEWMINFQPIMMTHFTTEAPIAKNDIPVQSDYELDVFPDYVKNGTMPVYRAESLMLESIIDPAWFNQSGIAEKKSETSLVFNDHATLQYDNGFLYYRQYTDQLYDYNTYQRQFEPDAEPVMLPIPAMSNYIADIASSGMFDYEGSARDAELENTQLTYLSLESAKQTAEALLNKLGIHGYVCSYALDMSVERIHTMGEAYNRFWHEGEGTTNQPRMDYSNVTAEDEGYYLLYTLMGKRDEFQFQNEAILFINHNGAAFMTLRSSFIPGDIFYIPDTLVSVEQAIDTLTSEAASSMHHLSVLSIESVSMAYSAVRADNKADGMVFVPVWQILYKDEECRGYDDCSLGVVNAVNGKLINGVFR